MIVSRLDGEELKIAERIAASGRAGTELWQRSWFPRWHFIWRDGAPVALRPAATQYVHHSNFTSELTCRFARRLYRAPVGCHATTLRPRRTLIGSSASIARELVLDREGRVSVGTHHATRRCTNGADVSFDLDEQPTLILTPEGILIRPPDYRGGKTRDQSVRLCLLSFGYDIQTIERAARRLHEAICA